MLINDKKNRIVFTIFTLAFFANSILFNISAGHTFITSIFQQLSAAIFFASLCLVVKDKRWLLIPAIVINAWCIANLVYVRSNNLILDSFALTMAGGMNGFWDSILIFFQWSDLLFFLITALASLTFIWITKSERSSWGVVILFGIALFYIGEVVHIVRHNRKNDQHIAFCLNTITREQREAVYGIRLLDEACETSILYTPLYILSDYYDLTHNNPPKPIVITASDSLQINSQIQNDTAFATTESPLLVLLVESLESWVCHPDIMPNLCRLLTNEHVLFANHMECQTVGAESADGQMIITTGLLPLHEGATCFRYPNNAYPSIMKTNTDKSVIMLPHDESVWNQVAMTPAYGYDSTIFISPVDSILFRQLNQTIDEGHKRIFCLTMSTHSPFKVGESSTLNLPKNMPYGMENYMRSFNVVDKGMAQFIDKIFTDSILQQYTIVITGDHTIFHDGRRNMFQRYCNRHLLDYTPGLPHLPLIIYSPNIHNNTYIPDVCYQMDIYPTILNLTNASGYAWKGFGVNLTDSVSQTNHPYSNEEASRLSDLIILNNYLKDSHIEKE